MDTERFEQEKRDIAKELRSIGEERAACLRLQRAFEQESEDIHAWGQHARNTLEPLAEAWQHDPGMRPLAERNFQSSQETLQCHGVLHEEGSQAFREQLRQMQWREEECRERRSHIQRILDEEGRHRRPSGGR